MRAAIVRGLLALGTIWAQQPQPQPPRATVPKPPQRTELQKAADEFRTQSRAFGLREDSPITARTNHHRRSAFHGRLFENFRNDILDAVPHEVVQRGGQKGLLRRNQYGFNLTGPVLIPRLYNGDRTTFFTFTFEGVREKIARTYLRTIPTLEERTGDWSHVVDQAGSQLAIYDPHATAPNAAYDADRPVTRENLQYQRSPFPGNHVPASRLDPIARKNLQHYPAPNTNAGPFFRNNYFIFAPEQNQADGIILRVDHNAGQRQRLGFGLNYSNGIDGAAAWFPNIANPGSVARDRRNRRATLEHVVTISPSSINTLTVDALTDQMNNQPQLDAQGRPFPYYRFDNSYLGMGQSYPSSRNARNNYIITNARSTRWRQHRLRFIGQLMRDQVNTFWPKYPEGSFQFSAGYTSLPGIVNTGHPFASYLLGGVEFAERSIVVSPSYFRKWRWLAAVRDQWEIRKDLTFSWGLNLDGSTPRIEKYDRQSTVSFDAINPANGRPGALVVAGYDGKDGFQPVLFKLEPSASLAWNVFGSTRNVLRAGYSRSYSPIPIYLGQWGTQAFNGNPAWVSANSQLAPAVVLEEGLPKDGRTFPDPRPESANNTVADLVEPTGRQPTYQSFSLLMERELRSFLVTIGSGHARGRNLLLSNSGSNPNAIPLSALQFRDQLNDEQFNRALRPFPQYQKFDVYSAWPEGRYQRDVGYVRIEKRTSAGLSLAASYEFSKQMDNYSGPYGVQDYYDRRNEWSLTSSNNPHRLSLSYMYELPFGPNKLFAIADWRRYVVEGWSVSGVTSLASGDPIALRPQFNNTGGVVDALHVDVVPGVDPHVAQPGPEQWFNPAAFAQPADFTTGNASRTHPSLRGPLSQNHDLSLSKRVAVSSERSLEFSMLGLNFINHANWTEPDPVIGPVSAPNVNAGRIIGSRGGRILQLGMKFSF